MKRSKYKALPPLLIPAILMGGQVPFTSLAADRDQNPMAHLKSIENGNLAKPKKVSQEEAMPVVPGGPEKDPQVSARKAWEKEINTRFQQGLSMLHIQEYDYAIKAFQRVIDLIPTLPEAHVNMGYILLKLKEYQTASTYFLKAIDLRPSQANAYYGLAEAYEGLNDLEAALGSMHSFLHLAKPTGKNKKYVNKARSALWEWEAKLGRGPWGPTKGIPPGFTEEALRRDGTGVGVKGLKREKAWNPVKPGGDAQEEDEE